MDIPQTYDSGGPIGPYQPPAYRTAMPLLTVSGPALPPVAELVRTVRRHLRLALFAGACVAALVFGVTLNLPKLYTAEAMVYVTPQTPDPLSAVAEAQGVGEDEVGTQAALLQSRDLAGNVVRQLAIGAVPPPPSPFTRMMCRLRAGFDPCAAQLPPTLDDRIGGFLKNLTVTPGSRSRVLTIDYVDRDPALAAAAVNTLIETFQKSQIDARAGDLSRTSGWLSRRAEELRQRWTQAEAKAGTYRANNGLAGAGARQADQPLIAQQIDHAANDLATAQAELAAASARQATIRAAGSGERAGLDQITQSASLAGLNAQLGELEVREAQLRAQYGDRHPAVLAIHRQLAAAQGSIAREMSRAVHAIDSDVASHRAAVDSLTANLASLRASAAAQSGSQVSLTTLENEASDARATYEAFLTRAKQLDERTELLQPQVQFAAHAPVPGSPSSPKTQRMLAGGIVMGLLAGIGAALGREYFSRGFANVSRVGTELSLPMLTAVPALPQGHDGEEVARYTSNNPYSAAAESVRSLAFHLQLAARNGTAPRSLVVTSATGSEGKTTLSIWLAHALASAGQRVLLIDSDHRRGTIAERLGGDDRTGFADVMTGEANFERAIQRDPIGGFAFIAGGRPTPRVFGERETTRLRAALQAFQSDYDMVIIDTPPLMALTEGLLYAQLCDATVIVCRWNSTARQAVVTSVERLNRAGARMMGVVLSMVDTSRLSLFSDDHRGADMRLLGKYYGRG